MRKCESILPLITNSVIRLGNEIWPSPAAANTVGGFADISGRR
jgi:hypothetical protein